MAAASRYTTKTYEHHHFMWGLLTKINEATSGMSMTIIVKVTHVIVDVNMAVLVYSILQGASLTKNIFIKNTYNQLPNQICTDRLAKETMIFHANVSPVSISCRLNEWF